MVLSYLIATAVRIKTDILFYWQKNTKEMPHHHHSTDPLKLSVFMMTIEQTKNQILCHCGQSILLEPTLQEGVDQVEKKKTKEEKGKDSVTK